MAKYRKKPVVIEAFQYDGDLMTVNAGYYVPNWAQKAHKEGTIFFDALGKKSPCEMFVKTLEGNHHASVGDYIIQGVQGEIYPCKPDIFEKTYVKVNENDNMLVSKEDCLARDNGDNTLTPYEVVCADENVFVIAPVSLNDDDSCTTDYQQLEAYSNDKSINSLESLGFIKIDD